MYATKGEMSPESLVGQKRKDFLNMVKDNGLVISALCGDLGRGFANAELNPELIRRSKMIVDLAKELGLPSDGVPCVIAATATPYKFPETCQRAFGADVLDNPPPAFAALETAPITQNQVVDIAGIDDAIRTFF